MKTDIDFAAHMEIVALALRGTPSSKHGNEWRYGTNGSLSIDVKRGTFFNHETKESGGTLAFIRSEKPGTNALDYLAGLGCIKKPRSPNGATPHEIPCDSASDPFNGVTFKNKSFRIVRTWTYVDENGADLFEVCRLENGETGADGKPVKTYRQRHKVKGEYIYNVKDVRQVPYRLPELTNAVAASKAIFITEGEACADAVIALGGVATCNAMGAGKWPDELTPYFKATDVVILLDNDLPGADHGRLVAAKLHGVARCVRILQLPDLPPKGDVVDWIAAGGTLAQLCELAETKSAAAVDGPLPLFPPLPDAEPYPVDALGPLSRAAAAIATKVQVPPAMAAQSVLASASLATCAHADVILPFGQARPLSLYFVSVSASGDRKSTADNEALWPVEKRETVLREENIDALREWKIEHAAWSAEKRKIEAGKSDFSQRKSDLTQLGDEPPKPLEPNLISDSPTVEGLAKNWPGMHASLGIFSTEGSMFTAGFGMNEDNRLKTAATLSAVWDGKPIKRIRAGDGVSVLPGRRLSVHLMIQPDAAGGFLSNAPLRDQGLLSRILVAKPESLAGTRLYKDSAQKDDAAIKAFGARILSILEAEPALAEGKRNELKPRSLPLSTEAKAAWVAFHDHVETQCGPSGDLAPVRDFAAKAAEHAARIAGVLTIVDDLVATEIGVAAMNNALVLMDWYLNEACRLQQGGLINSALLSAAFLLEWVRKQPEQTAAFREILQFGPSRLRTKAAAEEAIVILKSHNWIGEVSARPLAFKAVAP